MEKNMKGFTDDTAKNDAMGFGGLLLVLGAVGFIMVNMSGCSFQVGVDYWGKSGIHNVTSTKLLGERDGDVDVKNAKY